MKFFKIAILVFILFQLINCGEQQLTESEYLERAKQSFDGNEHREAIIHLKNTLKVNSNNTEARWLLGAIYVELGNWLAAEKELLKAKNLGVPDDDVIPLLMQSMLIQGKYSDVIKQNISGVSASDKLAEVLTSKGLAYLYQKKLDSATQQMSLALQRAPNSLYAITGNAQLDIATKNFKKAKEDLDKVLSIDDKYGPAWSALGDLAQEELNFEKAIEFYSKAINYRSDNWSDLLKRGMLSIRLKHYDNAQKDVDQLKERLYKNPQVNYAQGLLSFHKEKFSDAKDSLEQVLAYDENHLWAIYYLGAIHFLQNNQESARNYLSQFVSKAPGYVPGRKLLAVVKLRDNQYKQAEALLYPVTQANPKDVVSMNLLANALLKQGKTDNAIELFEKIVEIKPESAKARMRLGLGLLTEGEKERGIENLEHAVDIDPEFEQGQVFLVLRYLKGKKLKKALEVAKSFVNQQPDRLVARKLLGRVYYDIGEADQATDVFQAIINQVPGDPQAASYLALLALKKNNPEQAKVHYREILKHHPDQLRTLLNFAALEAQHGDREMAKSMLKQAINAHPQAVHPRILLVREYLKQGMAEKGITVLREISDEKRNEPVVLSLLGELQLKLNEFANAKATFKQLLEMQPGVAKTHFLLAKVYSGLNDIKGLKKELEITLKYSPKYIPARILLTRLMLAEDDISAAKNNLTVLQQEVSKDNSDILALEAAILSKSGKTKQALAIYKIAYEKNPNVTTLRFFTRFQWSIGQKDESIKYLQQWVNAHADDVSVMLELANNYLGMQRVGDAITQYQRVLELSGNNILALNNLAWQLRASTPKQALIYAEKAYNLAPELTWVMDTLAGVLLENGEITRAQRMINRALQKKPDDPTLRFHHALILDKNGQQKEAKITLKSLLNNGVAFPGKKEAQMMLNRLSSASNVD